MRHKVTMRKCVCCGKLYKSYRNDSKYCSIRCSNKAQYQPKNKNPVVDLRVLCVKCHKEKAISFFNRKALCHFCFNQLKQEAF